MTECVHAVISTEPGDPEVLRWLKVNPRRTGQAA
jgi:hypothetical protein